MSEIVELENLVPPMVSPYKVTKSMLGTTTKVMSDKFVCSTKELTILVEQFRDKIVYFKPSKASFQYLVSFTDKTHFENTNIELLNKNLDSSGKSTDKLILTWVFSHEYENVENELSITVRISNPINAYIMLQAIFSKSQGDMDNLEMADGSVCVSVNGANKTTAEEIFELVGRWIDSCPQPQSITKINSFLIAHKQKVRGINNWLIPFLYSILSFFFLSNQPSEESVPYAFLLLCGFLLLRTLVYKFNGMIWRLCNMSENFSMFMLTGGDQNQQTKFCAKAANSTMKLVASVATSFVLNFIAGIFVVKFISS